MSVVTNVYLPAYLAVQDIANVVAILAGSKVYLEPIPNHPDINIMKVENLKISQIKDLYGIVNLRFKDVLKDDRSCHLHYDGIENGNKLLSIKSTPFWIATGRRLIELFGGYIIHQDNGQIEGDEKVSINTSIWGKWWQLNGGRSLNGNASDALCDRMEKALLNLSPLRPAEIVAAIPFAAYEEEQKIKTNEFIAAFAQMQEDMLRDLVKIENKVLLKRTSKKI